MDSTGARNRAEREPVWNQYIEVRARPTRVSFLTKGSLCAHLVDEARVRDEQEGLRDRDVGRARNYRHTTTANVGPLVRCVCAHTQHTQILSLTSVTFLAGLRVLLAMKAVLEGRQIRDDSWSEDDMQFNRRDMFADVALADKRFAVASVDDRHPVVGTKRRAR